VKFITRLLTVCALVIGAFSTTALAAPGAPLLICPMCMKQYGVNPGEVLPGIKAGNPDLMESALFKPDGRKLTW